MKKLRGVKKMNKALRKAFFAATNIDIPMKLDSDFYYLPNKEKIRYSILVTRQSDLNFQKFLATTFNVSINSDIELFCISVLHEIGHYKTYNNIAKGDFNCSKKDQRKIEAALAKDPTNNQLYIRYFSLPVEIIATMWAVDFIETHPLEYYVLIETVQNILYKFYNKNITPVT